MDSSWRGLTSFPRHWVPCCPLGTVMAFHWDTSHPPAHSVLSELFAEGCDELSMDPTLWADLIPLLRSCWELSLDQACEGIFQRFPSSTSQPAFDMGSQSSAVRGGGKRDWVSAAAEFFCLFPVLGLSLKRLWEERECHSSLS